MFGDCLRQGARGYRAWSIACYCATLLVGGLSINILGSAGPVLCHNLHAAVTAVGTVFTAEGMGNALGSSIVGQVLERRPGHRVICQLCIVMFVIVALVPACESIAQVVFLYFLVGACMGIMSTTANTMVTWVQHGRNVGPWVNLVNACFGLGASGAPLLYVFVERRFGNGLAAFTAIGTFAAVPAIGAWLIQSPAQPKKEGTVVPAAYPTAEADESPRALQGIGASKRRSTICGIDLGSRHAYVRATVLFPMMAVMVLLIGAEIAFTAWIYSYGTHRLGMSAHDAAYLSSSYWVAFTAGRIAMVPLAACLTPGALLVPTLALNALCAVLMATFPDSTRAMWVGTLGSGIGVCALYSNAISLMSYYDLLTPRVTACICASSATGHMTIPNLFGLVIHHSSMRYEALVRLNVLFTSSGFFLLVAVVSHLSRNFTPAFSIGGTPALRPLSPREHGARRELERLTEEL